jgi:hypothetical protein
MRSGPTAPIAHKATRNGWRANADQPHPSSQTARQADAQATARANAKKSAIRAAVEHVFAHQKNRFGLFIRTIGLARAEAKLTLANLAYNFDRLIFHERRNTRSTPSP